MVSPLSSRTWLIIFTLVVLTIISAVAFMDTSKAESIEEENPFDVYEYVDSDGCEYLVFYAYEYPDKSIGRIVGVSTEPKIIQPEACSK